ncbi:hypothetical protein Chor_015607 [Crotalus horridus]
MIDCISISGEIRNAQLFPFYCPFASFKTCIHLCFLAVFFFKPSPLLGKLKCGENLFMSSHPFPWTRVIQSWYDENKNFRYGVGANPPNAVIGHYTQVVTEETSEVKLLLHINPGHLVGTVLRLVSTDYAVTNPCKRLDEYTNCKSLVQQAGCQDKQMQSDCSASCFCQNKII